MSNEPTEPKAKRTKATRGETKRVRRPKGIMSQLPEDLRAKIREKYARIHGEMLATDFSPRTRAEIERKADEFCEKYVLEAIEKLVYVMPSA